MSNAKHIVITLCVLLGFGCESNVISTSAPLNSEALVRTPEGKPVVYQVFTRLFGNLNTTNKPWGSVEENGVGKFNDFSLEALKAIRELGTTHIWYTGVLHHALIADYSAYGISSDDPDVVKGRAGSPYAVKDYYSVNPDLAVDPARRMQEFSELIERTHSLGLKVIIDIVPNHVARHYRSLGKPEGVEDFGVHDDQSVEYARDNNFYYIVGERFLVPEPEQGYLPLGGEKHILADGKFMEQTAKWTGNGSRASRPDFHDWYETVKINYGVKPDGSHDFSTLPESFARKDYPAHFQFWQNREVPDSWIKFRHIAQFWLDKGVDGFRYDMAEMVPVEFWSYLNSSIKMRNPNAFLLAEVYNPRLYRDYIQRGKMDYLYDKVELYDTLKSIVQGESSTDLLPVIQANLADIEHHMLHFLENHDEQRIASKGFAGYAENGKPAMVVSATLGTSPTLIYFGQELGEPADGNPGFGSASRTTIFDYWGVPAHQRWMNGGKFDGGQLTDSEKSLRDFYARLLSYSSSAAVMKGSYAEIHNHNRSIGTGYSDRLYSFVRWNDRDRLIVLANFDASVPAQFDLEVPAHIIDAWQLGEGEIVLQELLYGEAKNVLHVQNGRGTVHVELAPLESLLLGFNNK